MHDMHKIKEKKITDNGPSNTHLNDGKSHQ